MVRFLLELFRRAVGHNLAAINNDGPRANRLDFFQNVCRKNDGLFLTHTANQRSHLMLLIGIKTVRRLIQNQNSGSWMIDCAKQVRWR